MVLPMAVRLLKSLSSNVGAFTWSSLRWFQLLVVRPKNLGVLVLVGI